MEKLSWGYTITKPQRDSADKYAFVVSMSHLRYWYEMLKIILFDLKIAITFGSK